MSKFTVGLTEKVNNNHRVCNSAWGGVLAFWNKKAPRNGHEFATLYTHHTEVANGC